MRFGCCTSLWENQILALPDAGADYAEASFSSLEEKTLSQVKERAAQLTACGVTLEAMNVLFPGTLHLTGPETDFALVDR